jgi:hypothetical protein
MKESRSGGTERSDAASRVGQLDQLPKGRRETAPEFDRVTIDFRAGRIVLSGAVR